MMEPRPTAGEGDRVFGLLLFEAEECLARGQAEKALVQSSKAVKERPDSLTARALYERARLALLRGRRREKLEARIEEARRLFETGSYPEAERIVASALKLIPDHALAQDLFGRLKERRLLAPTAEAEAERELGRLGQSVAARALEAARTALAAGWGRRALLAARHGLRAAPDHPELLALHRELLQGVEAQEQDVARRRALFAQVRAGQALMAHGQLEDSRRVLQAVLREDPDNGRAQAALAEVRKLWVARGKEPRPAEAPPAVPAPEPTSMPTVAGEPRGSPPPPPPVPAAPLAPRRAPGGRAAARAAGVPAEILLPRTMRRRTPAIVIAVAALLILAAAGILVQRGSAPPAAPSPPPEAAIPPGPGAEPLPPGPLDQVEPALRDSIERTLDDYRRALEAQDLDFLGVARPDLGPAQRVLIIEPLRGALSVSADLRVLDVVVGPRTASVPVLRTLAAAGERMRALPPVEETLVFERSAAGWTLRR
jgi:tetratricopeptide (TPR) repeat protein